MSAEAPAEPQTRLRRALAYVRKNGVRIGLEVGFNFVGPFLIYDTLRHPWGDVKALLASSAPPIAWSLIEFARRRRIDALSILVLSGIALSLLAFFGGGGAKFLQLRETLVGGLIGCIFLGSVLIGRPLIYYLARATMMRQDNPAEAARLEGLRDNVYFRRVMTIMTLVWGFGLVAHTAVNVVLVFSVSIRRYLIIAPIIGYAWTGALVLFTFLYARRSERAGAARRAAAEAAAKAQAEAKPQEG